MCDAPFDLQSSHTYHTKYCLRDCEKKYQGVKDHLRGLNVYEHFEVKRQRKISKCDKPLTPEYSALIVSIEEIH